MDRGRRAGWFSASRPSGAAPLFVPSRALLFQLPRKGPRRNRLASRKGGRRLAVRTEEGHLAFWTSPSASRLDNGKATLDWGKREEGRGRSKSLPVHQSTCRAAGLAIGRRLDGRTHGPRPTRTQQQPRVVQDRKYRAHGSLLPSRLSAPRVTRWAGDESRARATASMLSSKQNSKAGRGDVGDDETSGTPYKPPIPPSPRGWLSPSKLDRETATAAPGLPRLSRVPTGDWLSCPSQPFVSVELGPTSTAKKQARPALDITSARWSLAIFTTNKSQKGERENGWGGNILQNSDGRIAKPSPNPPSGTSRGDGTGGEAWTTPLQSATKRPCAPPVPAMAMDGGIRSVHEWHPSTVLRPCRG